jgi:exodeoxyribonuclease VII large subunit
LCDFAADMRAPTPTAAAELAVPVRSELLAQVRELGARIERCVRRYHERAAEQLQNCLRLWPRREELLAPQQQRVDELADRLPRALRGRLDRARGELGHAAGALRPGLLAAAQRRARERLEALWRVASLAHPNRPLQRGYARVEDRDGHTLISAEAARKAQLLRLVFHDGGVEASVGDGGGIPPKGPKRSSSRDKVEHPKLL